MLGFFWFALLLPLLSLCQVHADFRAVGLFAEHTEIHKTGLRVNLGGLTNNSRVKGMEFLLINQSDSTLIIQRAYWAVFCGYDYSKEPAWRKNDTIRIKYFCHPIGKGPFSKTSVIVTNRGKLTINFRGTILDPALKTKHVISLEKSSYSDQLVGTIRLENDGLEAYYLFAVPNTDHISQTKISKGSLKVLPGPVAEVSIPFTISKEAFAESNHFQLGYQLGDKTGVIDYYMKY